MRRSNQAGYALMSVLVISFILFSLLSIALSTNYGLHQMNRRVATDLQQRADKVSFTRD